MCSICVYMMRVLFNQDVGGEHDTNRGHIRKEKGFGFCLRLDSLCQLNPGAFCSVKCVLEGENCTILLRCVPDDACLLLVHFVFGVTSNISFNTLVVESVA